MLAPGGEAFAHALVRRPVLVLARGAAVLRTPAFSAAPQRGAGRWSTPALEAGSLRHGYRPLSHLSLAAHRLERRSQLVRVNAARVVCRVSLAVVAHCYESFCSKIFSLCSERDSTRCVLAVVLDCYNERDVGLTPRALVTSHGLTRGDSRKVFCS